MTAVLLRLILIFPTPDIAADEVVQICPDVVLPAAPPEIRHARAAVLMDHRTGTVLYARNPDEPRVPASLTKLVAIYTALDAARQGEFDLDSPGPISPSAYASAVPPGSSLMFLGPEQTVDGWDLLRGLAISSGNDSAVEVALRVSGSVGAFSNRMNRVARDLGFQGMFFEEPAGLSPGNRVTAREMAQFSRLLLQEWPRTVEQLFSLPSFAYPEARHFSDGILRGNTIVQENRNLLLREYPGAEGLKTGYTSAAGYNLAASAVRDERRLIAIVLGVDGSSHLEGGLRRSADATELLDWGFDNFTTLEPVVPSIPAVTIWGSRIPVLEAGRPLVDPIVVPVSALGRLRGEIILPENLWAPLGENEEIGTLRYHIDGCTVLTVPVLAGQEIPEGSVFRRMWDRLRWWIRSLRSDR